MSGIPVYTQSAINAATADGVGPRTAAAAPTGTTQNVPNTNIATTTTAPSSTSSYPAARPGAPTVPAPTSAAQKYAPTQPTRTRKIEDEGPPLPQPGAVPATPNSFRSNLPPPPKAGERFNPPPPQTAIPQPYPPQMSIPPPPTTVYGAQPPSSSTSTTTTSSSHYPVALPSDNYGVPRRSLEHPPGYVQNPYASNFSAEQRRAQDVQAAVNLGSYGHDKPSTTAAFGVDPEGVWNTAKTWASTAGKKLSEVESEVWKRVNGEK